MKYQGALVGKHDKSCRYLTYDQVRHGFYPGANGGGVFIWSAGNDQAVCLADAPKVIQQKEQEQGWQDSGVNGIETQ